MLTVTLRHNADAPVSWVAGASFNMEHAITLLAIGQREWPDDATPRTSLPLRFEFTAPWERSNFRVIQFLTWLAR